MMRGFRLLAKLKGLRGTALDIFGRTEERRCERALIVEYAATVEELLRKLTPANHALAVEIASVPETDPRLRPRKNAPSEAGAKTACRTAG